MKRIALLLATPMFVIISPLPSYAADKPSQTTARDTSRDREQYERSMEERLKKVGKELDELKAKVAAAAERTEEEMKQSLAEAEQKQKMASGKLEELRKESAKRWKKLSAEMNQAVEDLEKACERARSRFKK